MTLAEICVMDSYEETYRSVPGVGFISARILANELGDLSQFANERQLFSYIRHFQNINSDKKRR